MFHSRSITAATFVGGAAILGAAVWSFSVNASSASATAANAAQEQPQAKQVIVPAGGRAGGLLTPGIMIGNTLYLSGQLGSQGKADGVAGETKAAINNALNILKAANMGLSDVVSVTAYLVDLADYSAFNGAYTELFTTQPRPTRTTVVVKELVGGAKVELTMTAVKTR